MELLGQFKIGGSCFGTARVRAERHEVVKMKPLERQIAPANRLGAVDAGHSGVSNTLASSMLSTITHSQTPSGCRAS